MKSALTKHQQKSFKMPKSPAPLVCLVFFKLFLPLNAWALELPNFWETMDKQAYDQFQQQNYEAAEDLFENPVWKGVTLYKLGRYQEAIHAFKKVQSPLSLYNLGNSHAQLGQFKQAEKAYQQALKLTPNPELKPKIEHNLKLIQKLLKQQAAAKSPTPPTASSNAPSPQQAPQPKTSQTQPNEKSEGNPQKPTAAENGSSKAKEKAQTSSNERQNSDPQSKPQGKSGSQAQNTEQNFDTSEQDAENLKLSSNPQNTDPKSDQKAAISSSLSPSETEQQQAQQTWLNQIPDQPELFIKRKFDYQYQQQKQRLEPEKIW